MQDLKFAQPHPTGVQEYAPVYCNSADLKLCKGIVDANFTKYNGVGIKVTDLIETLEPENLVGQAAQEVPQGPWNLKS